MKRLTRIFALLGLAALALALTVPPAFAAATRAAALRPVGAYAGASGSAQYQSQPGQRELDVELGHLPSLAGQRVTVFVAGSKVGTVRVSSGGAAEFSRNTERGQRVPQIQAGTPVAVATSHAVIMTGSF